MEIENSHISKSSISLKNIKNDDDASEIAMSELEALANTKKLNKKSEEISISKIIDKDTKKSSSINVKTKSIKIPSVKTVKSTIKSDSSDNRYRQRKINKENKNESIYKEKSEWLFKLFGI